MKVNSLIKSHLSLQGIGRLFKQKTPDSPWEYLAQYHNTLTKNAKDQILRSIAQSSSGTKLSASSYAKLMVFMTGTEPSSLISDNLDANGASALGWETLTTPTPSIVTTTSQARVTFEATYTASGSETVDFIAMVYDSADYDSSNVFVIIDTAPYALTSGQGLKCEYDMIFNYYTGGSEPI